MQAESPNEAIAGSVVNAMTNEKVLSVSRMTTGDQYFVYAVKTINTEYVIRMTNKDHLKKFQSGIYWQKKLLPLNVPLAKFIDSDLEGKYSPFPALLMHRLPGTDLCNVYSNLTSEDKKNLAKDIVAIQRIVSILPENKSFGIADSYEDLTNDLTWYDFLINRLNLFMDIIRKNGIYDADVIYKVINIGNRIKENLSIVRAVPFLWDASERNVIVYKGKISGIVDVDDICFGDPLFVIALTSAALEVEGHDTLYTDYWSLELKLNEEARCRLDFYKLFYTVVFMRKHSMITSNQQKVIFDSRKLTSMFQNSMIRINESISKF